MLKITPEPPLITDELSNKKEDFEGILNLLESGKSDISSVSSIFVTDGVGDDGNDYSDIQLTVKFRFTFENDVWFGGDGIAVNVSVLERWAQEVLDKFYG